MSDSIILGEADGGAVFGGPTVVFFYNISNVGSVHLLRNLYTLYNKPHNLQN